MKRFLFAAAALAALAAAAPASADPPRPYDRGYDRGWHDDDGYRSRDWDRDDDRRGYGDHRDARRFSREDIERLQTRIDWSFRTGALDRYDARRLSWLVADLRQRARYYWSDGMSWRDRRDLEARYDYVNSELRRELFEARDPRPYWRG